MSVPIKPDDLLALRMSSGPIKPEDVLALKKTQIPPEVFEAFNELIIEKLAGRCAVLKQEDVVDRILKKLNREPMNVTRSRIFDEGWLQIEKVYTEQGWVVEYDRPGFNETYPAVFKFTIEGE